MQTGQVKGWGILPLALALALVACQAKPLSGAGSRRPPAMATPLSTNKPASSDAELTRTLLGPMQRVALVGELRLISDHGGGLISNNGGALISDHGGGLVSNNGGALVSNHGGGLISNHGGGLISNHGGALTSKFGGLFQLAQEKAPVRAERPASESFLVDAEVEFLDAKGQRLVDAQGQGIGAKSDGAGVFRFEGELPKEALVARVRLWQGGQLLAMLVPDEAAAGGTRLLSLSTASSLGAAYVLDEFVKARPEVYAKLPPAEVRALYEEAEGALAKLGQAYRPDYRRDTLRSDLGRLRGLDASLDARMERIRALLLAGQAALGEGLLATQVALSGPMAAVGWADDALAVVELVGGRLRVVDKQGRLSTPTVTPAAGGLKPVVLREACQSLDGGILMADRIGKRVYKLSREKQLTVLAGNGKESGAQLPAAAMEASFKTLGAIAQSPDGTVWIGEAGGKATDAGRLLKLDSQGQVHDVGLPPETLAIPYQSREVHAIASFRDGSLAVLVQISQSAKQAQLQLLRLSATGQWGPPISITPTYVEDATLLAEADGSVLLSQSGEHRVRRIAADGSEQVVAGTGEAGSSGDGGLATSAMLNSPGGLWRSANGELYIADSGNGLIRAVDTEGRIRTVAGTVALTQAGDALAVSINGPGGLAVDSEGQVVVSELFTSTIKVLRQQRLEVLAGKGRGAQGDGGPVSGASFDTPTGLASGPLGLAIADAGNYRIRLISPSGQVRAVAGTGTPDGTTSAAAEPLTIALRRPVAVAQAKDGTLAWCDNENHCVWRLKPGAVMAERVAGTTQQGSAGLDGPGHLAQLTLPVGLAFGPDGLLYIADTGNLRVLRVLGDGRLERFAGAPFEEVLPRYQSHQLEDPNGTPRLSAALLGPATLAFDAEGRLYVGEAGTTQLESTLGAFAALLLPPGGQVVASRIRQITLDGHVNTVAGPGGRVLNAEDGDDALGSPAGLAFDAQGRLLIADSSRNQLKVVPASALP